MISQSGPCLESQMQLIHPVHLCKIRDHVRWVLDAILVALEAQLDGDLDLGHSPAGAVVGAILGRVHGQLERVRAGDLDRHRVLVVHLGHALDLDELDVVAGLETVSVLVGARDQCGVGVGDVGDRSTQRRLTVEVDTIELVATIEEHLPIKLATNF